MATGGDWSCPICREASGSIAYVASCLHQFCRGCIVRWARKNPSCPLCRQTVQTIIYSTPTNQGWVEMPVPQPSVPWSAGPEESGAVAPRPRAHVAGFSAETWALFFRNHPEILRPLELWLNEVLCGACWCDVAFAQGSIVASLCRYGLDAEALAREVQPFLHEQTATFVRHLIEVAADRCSELALRVMDTAPQQAGPSTVAFPGTSGAQEERREEPGPDGAEASGAGQSGGFGPRASQQSGRRRGRDPQGAQATPKKPCRRQN